MNMHPTLWLEIFYNFHIKNLSDLTIVWLLIQCFLLLLFQIRPSVIFQSIDKLGCNLRCFLLLNLSSNCLVCYSSYPLISRLNHCILLYFFLSLFHYELYLFMDCISNLKTLTRRIKLLHNVFIYIFLVHGLFLALDYL